jgi:hypothetical protein
MSAVEWVKYLGAVLVVQLANGSFRWFTGIDPFPFNKFPLASGTS